MTENLRRLKATHSGFKRPEKCLKEHGHIVGMNALSAKMVYECVIQGNTLEKVYLEECFYMSGLSKIF